MAGMTEAACLLKNGAAFARRAGLATAEGALVFAGTKPGAFALYFDDDPYYHLDLDGRWQRAYLGGTHYLKALDGTVEAIDRIREDGQMVLRRRRLPFAEAADLDAVVRAAALDLMTRLEEASLVWSAPPEGVALDESSLYDLLERVAARDASAWFRDREAFAATYGAGPLPFAPPTCSQPIVLRPTVPGTGSACWALRPERSIPLADEEFDAHARAVRAFLGRRVAQAKGIVLAGDDVLEQPCDRVVEWLKTATSVFPLSDAARRPSITERPETEAMLDGVYALLSAPTSSLDLGDWRRLAEGGLRHVDLGVVSGAPEVRAVHSAPWPDAVLAAHVASLHSAGIGVGLIVPVGSGGDSLAERHVQATASLLQAAPLVAGDIIYLVHLPDLCGNEAYETFFREQNLETLTLEARVAQLAAIREALMPLRTERKVKVIPYALEKQWGV